MAKPAIVSTDLRHVRPVQPLQFPLSDPEWDMPESNIHGLLCELVRQILCHALGREHSVGKDNFVYFDATQPKRCLAPDAFVKLGFPRDAFGAWKTWERGTPELCVEILSPSDTKEKLTFPEKLERYGALGTRELVVFDVDAPVGSRLRAWDRMQDDLVERVVEDETTPCLTLDAQWVIASGGELLPSALRLVRDRERRELLPTAEEAERARRVEAEAEIERLRKLLAEGAR